MKILFITSNRIGDAVLSTGVLNRLISTYPESKITVASGPTASTIFNLTPNVINIIKLKKQKYSLHWFYLWSQVYNNIWDLVIDLRSSLISFVLLSKSRKIYKKSPNIIHKVRQLSNVLGDGAPPQSPKIYIDKNISNISNSLINKNIPTIAIGPCANWGGKIWPSENFINLIKRITNEKNNFKNAKVAIFSSKEEAAMALPIVNALPKEMCINLTGKVDLLTAYACISNCSVYIGNDSGLMHLAAASGIPTLGLFGPSPEKIYRPWGENCDFVRTPRSFEQIISQKDYDYRDQRSHMLDLTVELVEKALIKLLKKNNTSLNNECS